MAQTTNTGPYVVKQGDTATPITGTLFDANDERVLLPSGTAVRFAMRPAMPGQPGPSFKKDARILSQEGRWAYDWEAEDVAVPGPYKAEVEVVLPNGPQTFPSDSYLDIIVLAEVG